MKNDGTSMTGGQLLLHWVMMTLVGGGWFSAFGILAIVMLIIAMF